MSSARPNSSRIVQKFGGTSVGNADAVARACAIVKCMSDRRPVVVVSAAAGVTNDLIRLGQSALHQANWEPAFDELAQRHRVLQRDLGVVVQSIQPLLSELHDLVRGIALIRELTPRTADYLASFGERLSARIVAAQLDASGVPARAIDAWDAGLVTDGRFGLARPLPHSSARIVEALAEVAETPVITGYIGRDVHGNITTLGRGGSDYSAAIFGAALHVGEIQIWTDVDGVMTADPRKVRDAHLLEVMSFAEAAELAFFGAKVLHPATMVPAVKAGIPIRVLNTFRPEAPGTRVVAKLDSSERRAKSIATKDSIVAVNVVANEMMLQYGFLERIADAFARHEVVVDVIATSEVSVALTTDKDARLEPVVAELAQFAEVTVVRDIALVSVVGEELKTSTDFAARVFGTLSELDVRLEMISYGATRNNLSFVVPAARLDEVVNALHERLFTR
jgi:aspartate kinase